MVAVVERPAPNRIDVSFDQWPLVVVSFIGQPSDQAFAEYLGILERNLHDTLSRGLKTAILVDTTLGPLPVSTKQRQLQADWLGRLHQTLRAGCAGTGFVVQSPVVRGVMTAVMWMQELPHPYAICATYQRAESWCIQRLAEANIDIYPRVSPTAM